MIKLNILLVEDDTQTIEQLKRDLPETFLECNVEANIDAISDFEVAFQAIRDPHKRFDLVISDTYKGSNQDANAAVLETIEEYKNGRFCPIVVYSSGAKPDQLTPSQFVRWADKSTSGELEQQIKDVLSVGIPQIARSLHEDIDKAAGEFLWAFLDENWHQLESLEPKTQNILDRLIRRRAALILSDLSPGQYSAVGQKYGLEYYIYPALDHDYYSLGDLLKCKSSGQYRVILTPHCHLFPQQGQQTPRAEYVLTVKTVSADAVLGQQLTNAAGAERDAQLKKIGAWTRSPAQTPGKPNGRHWFLPKLLQIPNLFCDFLQIESLEYEIIKQDFDRIATLMPPYAEALQECFSSFYGSVGIPVTNPESVIDLLNVENTGE